MWIPVFLAGRDEPITTVVSFLVRRLVVSYYVGLSPSDNRHGSHQIIGWSAEEGRWVTPLRGLPPSNESISQLEKGGGLFVSTQKGTVFPRFFLFLKKQFYKWRLFSTYSYWLRPRCWYQTASQPCDLQACCRIFEECRLKESKKAAEPAEPGGRRSLARKLQETFAEGLEGLGDGNVWGSWLKPY